VHLRATMQFGLWVPCSNRWATGPYCAGCWDRDCHGEFSRSAGAV